MKTYTYLAIWAKRDRTPVRLRVLAIAATWVYGIEVREDGTEAVPGNAHESRRLIARFCIREWQHLTRDPHDGQLVYVGKRERGNAGLSAVPVEGV